MSESKIPRKGSKINYKDVPFELISDLTKTFDEIGGGCRFKADCIIEGDDEDAVFEVEWVSIPAYDVVRRKIKARLRTIESLEHVKEEELYSRYGGKQFYGSDENVCKWDEPAGVYRKKGVMVVRP